MLSTEETVADDLNTALLSGSVCTCCLSLGPSADNDLDLSMIHESIQSHQLVSAYLKACAH